jgi:putative ABC transport system permease protein
MTSRSMLGYWMKRNGPTPAAVNGRYRHGNERFIVVRRAVKNYESGAGIFTALRGVDLQVDRGEFVGVIGKSGSGKSTLLNIIAGIDQPTSGAVLVGDTAVHLLREGQIAPWRGHTLGVIFQFFQLLPTLTAVENVMLPMDFCHMYTPRERQEWALHLLEQMGMADHAHKLPSTLSGGQQQRIAIARALANDPPLLLADEPTGNLDSQTAESVFRLFMDLVHNGKTILMVTHDNDLASRTTRAVMISDGEIVDEVVNKQRARAELIGDYTNRQSSAYLTAKGVKNRRKPLRDSSILGGICYARTQIDISPRWRKVLRDVWINWTRTLLVILSIAVGVFAIGEIASSRLILSQDLAANYAATIPSSAILQTAPFDSDLLHAIRRIEGVREAEGRRNVIVRLKVGPNAWRNMRLEAIDDYNDLRLDKIMPESGAWPPASREVLIERAALNLTHAQVGDPVLIAMPSGERRELRIVGLLHDMNQIPAAFSSTPYGYITLDTLEWLGYPRSFDELHILVTGNAADKEHIQTVVEQVKGKVENAGHTVRGIWIPEPGVHPFDNILEPMVVLFSALGFLSIFLSGFLVVNTISALLAQQIRQIGVMKAIGASTSQIVGMYLGVVLIFGMLALAIAVPFGAVVAYRVTAYIASLINFDLTGFRFPLQALALDIIAGLIVPLGSALYPVLTGARITVREAISSYGHDKDQFGSGRFDQLLTRVRGLPRPLLLSLRNTFRRQVRLALTLGTLILGGTMVISVFSVRASLLTTLDDFAAYWNYDIDMDFDRDYPTQRIVREALRTSGVVAAESWGSNDARRVRADGSEGPNFDILAPPGDTDLLRPVVLEGRWLRPDDTNAIVLDADVLDQEPDIKVNDQIVLKIERHETSWRVVGIVQKTLTATHIRRGTAYVNNPHFARVMRSAGSANNVRLATEQHDAAFQASIATALQDHYDSVGMHAVSVRTTASIRESIRYQFNILVIFLSIMATILAIVGALGVTSTMSLNVLERAREIGIMRAIGASDGSVLQIFLVEGILIGLLSWPAAVILALPISKLLSDVVGDKFTGTPLTYTFSTKGALFWLAIVFLLAALASFVPAWNASRLSVREVLTYE